MTKIATRKEFEAVDAFGVGAPNEAFAQYFIGESFLKPATDLENGEFPLFNVAFEPGCRNNWHVHHASAGGGQILICTAGEGWYQEWGKPAVSMEAGSVVCIPANVKHWHGAKKDSWFSHLTFEPAGEDTSNEWLEPVTDDVYGQLA
ncbi:MAG: cupin domain-containing protein [Coriobacteriia bacterium]|nr:cupin domain-containing protein [Coriobacteriia bacterium]